MDMNDHVLSPNAQKRVFCYEFRGPIPSHHHCRRSLFGSGPIDIPQTETPKKSKAYLGRKNIASKGQPRSRSYDRKFLSTPTLTQEDAMKQGLTLHQLNCEGCGSHGSKSNSTNTTPVKSSERRRILRPADFSHEVASTAQERLDNWESLNFNRSRSADPVSASTPTELDRRNNIPEQDEDGYAIPSIVSSTSTRSPQRTFLKSPLESGSTPQHLYRTPMTEFHKPSEFIV